MFSTCDHLGTSTYLLIAHTHRTSLQWPSEEDAAILVRTPLHRIQQLMLYMYRNMRRSKLHYLSPSKRTLYTASYGRGFAWMCLPQVLECVLSFIMFSHDSACVYLILSLALPCLNMISCVLYFTKLYKFMFSLDPV